MPRRFPTRERLGGAALVLATALTLRAVHGYRPFPSVDDFVYVPLARAARSPELYPGDSLLHGFVVHSPVWTWLVFLGDHVLDLATLFWLVTLALSIATVAAAYRILRLLGGPAYLLPLLAWIAFSGRVNGIGRGQHEGAFGDAFHVQWLALCLLLWAYAAFMSRRSLLAGALLGLSAVGHPVVAAHGAIVLACATLVGGSRLRSLVAAGVTAFVVSSAVSVPLLVSLTRNRPGGSVPGETLVQGYLFRTPQEFTFRYTTDAELMFLALVLLAGAAGALALRRRDGDRTSIAALGLLAGHVLLLAAAIVVHGPWTGAVWLERSTIPFLLHLTRTTPLIPVLGGALALAAAAQPARTTLWRVVTAAAAVLLLAPLSPGVLPFLALAGLAWAAAQLRTPVAVPVLGAWAAAALGYVLLHDVRAAPVADEERALYDWVRRETPPSALFIIPPGYQAFRLYALRGAYVDFKLFPATTPRLIPEWRRRLELVAAPDSATAAVGGWPGMAAWDSSYANRNTPERIADLLRRAGADYFLLDLSAATAAPAPQAERRAGIVSAYSSPRFRVYRRGTPPALQSSVHRGYLGPPPGSPTERRAPRDLSLTDS